MGRLFCL